MTIYLFIYLLNLTIIPCPNENKSFKLQIRDLTVMQET